MQFVAWPHKRNSILQVLFGCMTNVNYVLCHVKMKPIDVASDMNGLVIFVPAYCSHGKTRPGFLFHFPASCLLSLRHKTTLILRDAAKFHPCSPQEFVYGDGWKLSTNWKITPTFTRNKSSFLDPRSDLIWPNKPQCGGSEKWGESQWSLPEKHAKDRAVFELTLTMI